MLKLLWVKFRTAFLIPEVTGPLFGVSLTLIGLFQTSSAVSLLVGAVWGIIAYAVFKGKTRWWLMIMIMASSGTVLYLINPHIIKIVEAGKEKHLSSPTESIRESQEERLLIRNGSFDDPLDFNGWVGDISIASNFVSPDSVATSNTLQVVSGSPQVPLFIDRYGRNMTRCFFINNERETKPNEYYKIFQTVDGLQENTEYELTYWVWGRADNPDSVWISLGGDFFSEKLSSTLADSLGGFKSEFKDWTPIHKTLVTGNWTKAVFRVVSNHRCQIRVDDISLVKKSSVPQNVV